MNTKSHDPKWLRGYEAALVKAYEIAKANEATNNLPMFLTSDLIQMELQNFEVPFDE